MKNNPKKKYSPEQKNAIEVFDRNVSVSAGAGSGKTTILVERFLYAITVKKMEPGRILAITFTDKAANEMKGRLVEQCRERGLHELRRSLETAYISTIHGFCSRILKENPIESGVDPFFQVLGDGEAEILMNRLLDKIFQDETENETWLSMLASYGEDEMRSSLKSFYAMERSFLGSESLFAVKDFSKDEKEVRGKILSGLDALLSLGGGPEVSDSEKKHTEAALELRELFKKNSPGDWKFIHTAQDLKMSLNKRLKKFREGVEELRGLIDLWTSLKVEELSEPVKIQFISVFTKFKNAYDQEKRRLSTYDFEDLLYITWQLLSGSDEKKKAVQRRYRELFSLILVDEYQDTSPLQDRIIGLLADKDNLFIVGDVQQSIYGFRHADPEVFEKRLAGSGKRELSGRVILNDNYRSRGEILLFVNKIFGQFFEGRYFEVLRPKKIFSLERSTPVKISCVVRAGDDDMDRERLRILEAKALALGIQERIEKKIMVEDEGQTRPIRYGDIAILLRSATSSYLYEQELRDLSIPYYAAKSEGFYEKPEVMDLLNLLKLIENPLSDIPLAGVLRSPFVHISDDALFWIARKAKSEDEEAPLFYGFEKMDAVKELAEADKAKLKKFKELFLYLRDHKNKLRIMDILERSLQETQYEAKLLTRKEGVQAVANVRKLVETSRLAADKGVLGIEDFVRFTQALSEREKSQGEAKIQSESRDSVSILTIHGAKGLEFPCVIIANMGGDSKNNRGGAFSSSLSTGMGVKLRSPIDREYFKDFTFSEIEKVKAEKEHYEEDRLLYVAMTRAKEELVLSGSAVLDKKTGAPKEASSWMSRIIKLFNWDGDTSKVQVLDFQGAKAEFLKIEPTVISKGAARTAKPEADRSEKEVSVSAILKRLEVPSKSYEEKEDLTVTDLLLAFTKRDERKSEIIIQEENIFPDEDEEVLPRNEYGTLFHKIMEFLAIERPKKVSKLFLNRFLKQGLDPAQKLEMEKSVLAFWSGEWGELIRRSKKCYPELPFIYKTRHGMLKGQIDLVFQQPDGEWVILDYKTHQINLEEKEATAKDYEFQLSLYALIFKKLYGEDPARGVLYFSALADTSEFVYRENDFDVFEARLNSLYEEIARSRGLVALRA